MNFRVLSRLNEIREKYAKFGRAYIVFRDAQSKNTFLKEYKPMFIDDKGRDKIDEFLKVRKSLYGKSGSCFLSKRLEKFKGYSKP